MILFLKLYRYRLQLFTLILLFPYSVSAQLPPPSASSQETHIHFETERIHKGVYLKSYRGDDLYDSKQSINFVEVWLDSTTAQLTIAYDENQFVPTSEFAEKEQSLAAINGSFFDTESGGSVVFMKINGTVIAEGAVNNRFYTESGAIGWNKGELPLIYARPENGWESLAVDNILSSGPLLIMNQEILEFSADPFNQNRHPRTAVALTNDNKLLLVTVDGRSFQSYGMSIPELANFLHSLDAKQALNMDGGGSTTMWIRHTEGNGIVNYPSDNMEFDHKGERNISNALLLQVQ